MASRKRSAVWLYYQDGEDPNKVVCLICLEAIQHCGNTSNMLKHLRSKHHAEYADVEAKKRHAEGSGGIAYHRSVQQTLHHVNNGTYPDTLGSVAGGEAKEQAQLKQEDEGSRAANGMHNGEPCSSVSEPRKLSVVWEYYQERPDGSSALCLLCSENVLHWRNESNLLRHLRKRHPVEYGYLEGTATRGDSEEEGKGSMVHCSLRRSSLQEEACRISGRFPDIFEVITVGQSEQDQVRRALEQEARALERERELTMQLRRAQEQEARALGQQRELTEQLRRAQEQEVTRLREQEAQALNRERQAIEQLRRAQEQEARAIEREREALEQLRRELEQERRALQEQKGAQSREVKGREWVTLGTQTDDAELRAVML